MLCLATTTVSLLAGTSVNAAGDVVDSATPSATGIPASIVALPLSRVQTSRRGLIAAFGSDRVDGKRPRDIRSYIVRVPAGTVVSAGNRWLDERTGTIYLVDGLGETQGLTRVTDLATYCRRVA